MPINTARISFGAIGYPDWYAEVHINPRSSLYAALISVGDDFWQRFGQVVLSWNLADEDGQPFPLPREVASEQDLDLPVRVIGYLFEQYIDAVRDAAGLPKVSGLASGSTSTTSTMVQERA